MTLILSLSRGRAAQGVPTTIPLDANDIVVGAAPDCDWRLEDGVAPRHCQFGFRGGAWLVVDLGGGTRLNGQPLDRPSGIGVGDVLSIGACQITVADAAVALPPSTGPGDALLAAAGLTRAQVPGSDPALIAAAGALVRHLVAGMVDQLAQRARAKAQMGAEATQFAFGPQNPLKTLPADRALAALLTPPAPATMPADRAVADAFADLEAHQAATLGAMQQALASTLERFSPSSIRARATSGGLMARVLPGAKEAALWQAYEREFDGVAKGSSDAFVELFADEFKRAYQAVSSAPRRPS